MSLFGHVRSSWRMSIRSPLISLGALVCIALGIGSTTALFSVLEQLVLHPIPYPNAAELAIVRATNPARGAEAQVSRADFETWQSAARTFRSLAAYQPARVSLNGHDFPEALNAGRISAGFFETLGVRPVLGRTFTAEEVTDEGPPSVLLSEERWQRDFNRDAGVLGRTIFLNKRAATIVGIVPAGFRDPFGLEQDCWIPLWFDNPAARIRESRALAVIGRLATGQSVESAQVELRGLSTRSAFESSAADQEWKASVASLEERIAGAWRAPAVTLFAAVALVLFIACANIGALLLARTAERGREFGIRRALGATRAAIGGQLASETLILLIPGVLAGLMCANLLQKALIWLRPVTLSRLDGVALNAPVLLFAIAAATVTVVLCTVLPLIQALRGAVPTLLRPAASGLTHDSSLRVGLTLLTIAEIALSIVLLVTATMVTRDLLNRWPREVIEWRDKLTIRVTLPPARYKTADERLAYVRAASDELATLPGVVGLAQATIVPYDRYMLSAYVSSPTSRDVDLTTAPSTDYAAVSPDYFRTLGLRPLEGRAFVQGDTHGAPGVFVVTQSLAQQLWPGQSPLRQRLTVTVFNPSGSLRGDVKREGEVVGIVPDVRSPRAPNKPQLLVYASLAQHPFPFVRFVIAAPHAASLVREARSRLNKIDPDIVPDDAITLEEMLDQRLELSRFYAVLTSVFASIGLFLAVVGVYAVTAYMIHRRRYEFGVRAAIGGSPRQLFLHVVRDGLLVMAGGVIVGCFGAFAAKRLVVALMADGRGVDVISFGIAVGGLVLAAAAAVVVAALRATRISPLRALRDV